MFKEEAAREPTLKSHFGKLAFAHHPPTEMGFHCASAGKAAACNVGDLGLIPGLEDPLEKGKATHSSFLAWRIPWTLQSMGLQKLHMTERLSLALSFTNRNKH